MELPTEGNEATTTLPHAVEGMHTSGASVGVTG
jgi:hypothetical protein